MRRDGTITFGQVYGAVQMVFENGIPTKLFVTGCEALFEVGGYLFTLQPAGKGYLLTENRHATGSIEPTSPTFDDFQGIWNEATLQHPFVIDLDE